MADLVERKDRSPRRWSLGFASIKKKIERVRFLGLQRLIFDEERPLTLRKKKLSRSRKLRKVLRKSKGMTSSGERGGLTTKTSRQAGRSLIRVVLVKKETEVMCR